MTATKADLVAVERLIGALTPEQRAQLAGLPGVRDRLRKWIPNPGPQTTAYYCDADELFYGGQAGGGKTDLLGGLALTAHNRSLVLRRTHKEASKLVERFSEIIGSRNGWNGQDQVWRIDGRVIDISGCQHEDDKQKFKGTPHDLICVGAGTPVMLADGTFRHVNELVAGDMLATLEGPRRLTRLYPAQLKQCVEVVARDSSGRELARQVQSSTHALLSETCLTSADDHFGVCGSTQCRDGGKPQQSLRGICSSPWTPLVESVGRFWHKVVSALLSLGRLFGLVTPAFLVRSGRGICCAEFVDDSANTLRPPLSFAHLGLLQPFQSSSERGGRQRSFGRGVGGGQKWSSPQDLMDGCLAGPRPCGEHTRHTLGFVTGARAGQRCLLLQGDAGQPSPSYWLDDVSGQTQECSRQRRTYIHPYTGETRSICADGSLLCATLDVHPVGVKVVHDLQVEEVNHYITKGGFVNKNCFDEVSDFTETQYRFIIGWNRSSDKHQRCRVVAAGNPPTTPEGLWVLKYWGPWVDPSHPNPARPGELRWFTTANGEDTEVDGPGPHLIEGEEVMARSRSFIPAALDDNPDLAETNYSSVLAALPAELRAAYKEGRFDAALKDNPKQVIPTRWILEAQARWRPEGFQDVLMTAMAFDPAGGGNDNEELIWRHGGWFSEPISAKGSETKDGSRAAGVIVTHRRHNASVIVDVGGGYGGAVVQRLSDNGIHHHAFNGANTSTARTRDAKLGFFNKRSEAMWRLREELDPDQEGGSVIALPPGAEVRADLAAPQWELTTRGIKVESKDDIRKRLGRSPGKGDVIAMCLTEGQAVITRDLHRATTRKQPKVLLGYANVKKGRR